MRADLPLIMLLAVLMMFLMLIGLLVYMDETYKHELRLNCIEAAQQTKGVVCLDLNNL